MLNSGAPADIGLMLEGTYPFVSGGVSSWVRQIIDGFPQFTFALVFLGGAQKHYGDTKYPLPSNVVHLEVHYLMDPQQGDKPHRMKGDPAVFATVKDLHEVLRSARGIDLNLLHEKLDQRAGRSKRHGP